MRRGRGAVVVIASVLVWGFLMPMAIAAGLCPMMGGLCEGPCGATLATAGPTVPTAVDLVGRADAPAAPITPAFDRAVPEPPPRSVSLSS